ncbi:MAG: hypothetical protein LBV46_00155, partial [Bacteroidales bacterium]|nr:hypothetical protein [Bacteroidales bacterium]
MKNFFLGFILFAVSSSLFAQRFSGFSGNISLTPTEVKEFMATDSKDRQKEADDIAKQFEKAWISGKISPQIQQDFIDVANHLVNKKMRPIPHFQALWNAYQAFSGSEDLSIHDDWKNMVDYIIDNDQNSFVATMDNFVHFFQGKYIYYHTNVKWRVDGAIDKMGTNPKPYLSFKKIDLIGSSHADSLTIINTTGNFYPSTGTWSGTGGEVTWERAGLGENVKAKLLDYNVTLKFSAFSAENVSFYYPRLFGAPLKGKLEEKATFEVSEEKATYPRFKSYDNSIAVRNIYENVDYIGGFEMRGAAIMGSSADEKTPARILVRNSKGRIVLKAESYHFLLRPEVFLSESARISIYFDQDSIYHSAANLKYSEKSKELIVSRPKDGVGRAPFFDSYHKMDIYAESIQWKTEEERIEIRPIVGIQSPSPAIFESQNYYDPSVMRQVQGLNEENPLYQLWEIFNKNKLQPIKLETVARSFKRELVDIKRLMIDLAARGFVEYDVMTDEIHYRRKMTQYLNNAVNVKDYDNIVLESKTHFASIDLVTNKLNITGCEFFVLSDAQIVNVYPTDEKVTVKKNRDMTFSGKIIAGLFDFASHQCEFNYDDFSVGMNVVDTMVMYVEDQSAPTNVYQEHKLRRIRSVIEELSGTLYIDVPGNKCGRIDYPDYPMFEARKGGKVFYDSKAILGGVYTRDKFSYSLN